MKRFMKRLMAVILSAAIAISLGATVLASAAVQDLQFHDPLDDYMNPPVGASYSGLGWNTNFAGNDYFGSGGDSNGYKLDGADVGILEYEVSGATRITGEYYFLNLPFAIKSGSGIMRPSNISQVTPENALPGFVDSRTGVLYTKCDADWYVYLDEKGTADSHSGFWNFVNTSETAYSAPEEEYLIPFGSGFGYTTDGVTWQIAENKFVSGSKGTSYNREYWSAEIPAGAKAVRAYLVDRKNYTIGNDATGEISFFKNDTIGWYMGVSDIMIDYQKDIENNRAPVADAGEEYSCLQNRAIDIQLSAHDADGDPLAYTITKQTEHGSLKKISEKVYKYIAPSDYSGEVSFSFKVNDGYVDSQEAQVKIMVEEHDGSYLPEDVQIEYPQVDCLTLNSVFTDGMVFQQNEEVNVWGLTVPGRTVTARLTKGGDLVSEKSAEAGENGLFEIALDPVAGSFDQYVLTIDDAVDTKTIENVVFGEVWLSAGQSNMELQVQYTVESEDIYATADDPYIRFFLEPTNPKPSLSSDFAYRPQFDIEDSRWGFGDVHNDVAVVSAVAYHFAVRLYEELQVPVAILNTSIGSTSVEAWISRKSIEDDAAVLAELKGKDFYFDTRNWNTRGEWNFNQMSAMFNHKIAPLTGMNIKGILWYQGENNVGNYQAAQNYKNSLSCLIRDYTEWFGAEEDLPFIFTQLSPSEYEYEHESLAYMHEAFSEFWQENPEDTAMTVIYDVDLNFTYGDFAYKTPVHPLVKGPVGTRMGNTALQLVYGKETQAYSPVYESMTVSGNKLVLKFKNAYGGLKSKDGGVLKGFTVCGEDRIFVPAEAKVVGTDTVEVWSDAVQEPVAAAYAFSAMAIRSNLCNSSDLMCAPFRTDKVESLYYAPKYWMDADSLTEWIDITQHDMNSGEKTLWVKNPVSGTTNNVILDIDEANKVQGNGSLSFEYRSGGRAGAGVKGFAERLGKGFDPIFGQFDDFNSLEFYVKNNDARAKEISVNVKTTDGSIYHLCFTSDLTARQQLAVTDEWQKFTVYLGLAEDEFGKTLFECKDIFSRIESIEFCISDTARGSVNIDGIALRTENEVSVEDFENEYTKLAEGITEQKYTQASYAAFEQALSSLKNVFTPEQYNTYYAKAVSARQALAVAEGEQAFTAEFVSDGQTISKQTLAAGDMPLIPPAQSGETAWIGWCEEGEETPYDFSEGLHEDIVLYATFETPYLYIWNVSFNSAGGSAVATQSVENGKTASVPEPPVREGYEFVGWLLDGKAFDFATPITDNITLTASWKELENENIPPDDVPEEGGSCSGTITGGALLGGIGLVIGAAALVIKKK